MKRLFRWFGILCLAGVFGVLLQPASQYLYAQPPAPVNEDFYSHYERDVIKIKFRSDLAMRMIDDRPVDVSGNVTAASIDSLYALTTGGSWERSQSLSEASRRKLAATG